MSSVKSYMIAFKLSAMLSGKYAKTFELAESKAARLGEKFSRVGSAMSKAITLPLVGIGRASIKAAQDWESAWVGVRKVTNATEEDLQALEATAREMARELPHTHNAIASVFEAGSRLGIATDYLEGFSRTMLAVESVTTLTLDKAASGFANIANVMGTSHGDFDRMGSAVLKLGNNFNTTEADILKMASRLAGSASAIGMTESQLMALSTATGAVGITAEVGATAFNTLMRDMQIAVASGSDDLQAFADIAGKSVGDFQRAFQDDAMSAIVAFIGGLSRVEEEGGSLAVTLSDMGYNADGIYRTLMNLSGGYDILVDALEMSNTAWEENSELTKAVGERYATMEARMQVMRNQMRDAGITIGEALMPFVEKLVGGIGRLVEWFSNLDEGTQQMIIRLGLLAAAAGPVLMVGGKVLKFAGKINATYKTLKGTIMAVKTATELKSAAQAANTKLTKVNTAVAETAKKASAARKAATLAENKALKLAAQAEIVRATSGATSAKAIAATTAAEKARTVATKAGKIANKHAATLDKIRTNQAVVNTAALKANTAAQTASTLTTTKLGKALTFLSAKKAAAIVSAKAFTASLKGMSVGMKLVTIVKAALTLGAKALAVGFKIMSVAIMKIPVFGWILAAVTGVIAVVGALVGWLSRVSEEQAALAAETERLVEVTDELIDSVNQSAEAFAQQQLEMERGQYQTEKLLNEILALADGGELTAGEMLLLEKKIADLNDIVPGLALAFDEQTGALNMTAQALQDYIGFANTQMELDAMRARQVAITDERLQAERQLSDIHAQQAEVQDRLNRLGGHQFIQRGRLNDQLRDLNAAEDRLRTTIDALNAEYEALSDSILDHAELLAEQQRIQEEVNRAMEEAAREMAEMARAVEEWEKAQSQALDKLNSSFENYKRITTNVFSTVSQNAAVSVADMTANLMANAAAVEEWSINMAILAERGLDEGLLEQLRQAGPEAAATIEGLVNACSDELEALNYAFENSTRVAMESMQREFDPLGVTESAEELIDKVAESILANEAMENALIDKVNASFAAFSYSIDTAGFDDAGYEIPRGVVVGIQNGEGMVVDAARTLATNTLNAMQNEMAINSPSEKTKAFGAFLTSGIAIGIYSEMDEVEKACKDMSKLITDSLYFEFPKVTAPDYSPNTGYNRIRDIFSDPADYIGLDRGGYRNAFGSHLGFDRFTNLNFDEDDPPFQAARPIDSINRMNSADTYNDSSGDFHYHGSPITIDGSGLSADELEEVLERYQSGEYARMERFYKEKLAREKRMANV